MMNFHHGYPKLLSSKFGEPGGSKQSRVSVRSDSCSFVRGKSRESGKAIRKTWHWLAAVKLGGVGLRSSAVLLGIFFVWMAGILPEYRADSSRTWQASLDFSGSSESQILAEIPDLPVLPTFDSVPEDALYLNHLLLGGMKVFHEFSSRRSSRLSKSGGLSDRRCL